MINIDEIAAKAEIIIGGFAVLEHSDRYKVVNLNTGAGVAVFTQDGSLVETNMDDIELSIARDVLADALKYAEV